MTDSASEPGQREPHRHHRPRVATHDDLQFSLPRSVDTWHHSSRIMSPSTASLASSLRRFPIAGADEDDASSLRWGADFLEDRRRLEDERRVTQILADPQLRSKMLIGQEDNRYQWHKYWTTGAELAEMRTPM